MRQIALAGIGIATTLTFAAPASADPPDQPVCYPVHGGGSTCAFYSPTHQLNCEIQYHAVNLFDEVFCENASQAVTMDAGGGLTNCTDSGCVGNPGIGTATLAYGQTAAIGPFSCLSATSGMTCSVGSGRGFTISTSGVTPI
jgi:hypothetical protein